MRIITFLFIHFFMDIKEEKMKPELFSRFLRVVIIGVTLIGIACCAYVIPEMGRTFESHYPEFSNWVLPWVILLYVCAAPCFVAMGLSWRIAGNIGRDRSFCMENAKLFKIFAILALVDSAVFGAGSIVYTFAGMNHPGLVLIDLLIVFAGLAIFVITSALSYLVAKAAGLQEDSDLTI